MSYTNLHVNDHGWTAKLRLLEDGQPLDISTFSTLEVEWIRPDGTSFTRTASFDTDGRDGVIRYIVEPGTLDRPGRWGIRARIANASTDIRSETVWFHVRR